MMSGKTRKAEKRIHLKPELTLADIATFRTQLVDALRTEGCIELELSAVESVDTASLQLLAAFINRLRDTGRSFRWHGYSEAMLGAARLLGLERHLELKVSGGNGT